jgi:phosphatidylinositol glycan class N
MNNIQVVDSIVQQTEELFSDFYHDQETSFIFTADHGMSMIGNHGDGGEFCAISVLIMTC